MSTRKTVATENTAQAFLEMLEALGMRYPAPYLETRQEKPR